MTGGARAPRRALPWSSAHTILASAGAANSFAVALTSTTLDMMSRFAQFEPLLSQIGRTYYA